MARSCVNIALLIDWHHGIMNHWKSLIDPDLACWEGYRELIAGLPGESFPGPDVLGHLLPPGTASGNGLPIQFVPASRLPGVKYEKHIYETGEVSTRENSWHDLFNALTWCRLPNLKAAMNARHHDELGPERGGRRGKLRDALTLLDESGVIVAGSNPDVLQALVNRDWNAAFVTHRAAWHSELQVLVSGHALLEKFLNPYKSMTAHALILHTSQLASWEQLDVQLGILLSDRQLFDSPAGLSPLPLMGIPGWWPAGEQAGGFYDDRDVFRPAAVSMTPAPIYQVVDS
jgi:hypothetical protein